MVHIRKQRIVFVTILSLLAVSLPVAIAANRGIHVVSKQGEELYLYKDYHALVVGVGDYDHWPDLRGAARDAEEVAQALRSVGMNVDLLLNPTSKVLKDALNILTYGVGNETDRAILFFFSGHGDTETLATGEQLGYILPKDAPLPSKDRIGFINTAVSMNQIETYALRIQSKHVLMLFDSCFSGSVFASLKGIPTDITEKSNRPVRQFITAGNENEQVPDVSTFKTCFIQGIRGEADANSDGYVTGSELGMYLDSSVVNYSRGCQHPQYGKIRHPKLDKGDFIIKLASVGVVDEEPALLADHYMEEKQYDRAIDIYKKMIMSNPKDAGLYSSIGYAYSLKGDTDRAIANYRVSLRYGREDDIVHCRLGNAYEKKGMYKDALKEYTNAYQINPDSGEAASKIEQMRKEMLLLKRREAELKIEQMRKERLLLKRQ